MGILILIIIIILFYCLIFHKSKSDIVKLREGLKKASTEDLKFLNELIQNELNKRNEKS